MEVHEEVIFRMGWGSSGVRPAARSPMNVPITIRRNAESPDILHFNDHESWIYYALL
jgi:phosphoserine aminotransferase